MKETKALVIAAMEDVELNYIKKQLENLKKIEDKICTFYEGIIKGENIVLCESNVGLINTAMSLTHAIEKYKPKVIINEGIAGGCEETIHKKEIIIGTQAINITSIDTTKKNKGEGIDIEGYTLATFKKNDDNNEVIEQKANEKLIELAKKIAGEDKKIHFGKIGSGDIWNRQIDMLLKLNRKYKMLCEDMEAISVYTIANKYEIPAISIKVVSDNIVLGEEYERNISDISQIFTIKMIESLIK